MQKVIPTDAQNNIFEVYEKADEDFLGQGISGDYFKVFHRQMGTYFAAKYVKPVAYEFLNNEINIHAKLNLMKRKDIT